MGGVRIFLALVLALGCVGAPALADDMRTLAREKAAAVSIMREKAAKQICILAQDRVFGAYLTATTQGEGVRRKRRIEAAFATINTRFGLREVTLIARDGVVVAHVAKGAHAVSGEFNLVKDTMLMAGFALDAMNVSTLVVANGDKAGYAISHVTPVAWHGDKEFVLRGEQDMGAYKAVLASGVGEGRYVALIDETRSILSDAGTNPGAQGVSAKLSVAGFSFDGIRRAVKGSADAGSGEIALANKRFNVGYQSLGRWTIVAVEAAAPPRRCASDGARLCG
ncbi:MAG: hypothetical protein ABL996_17210 [Micropepsaceae bacterium]